MSTRNGGRSTRNFNKGKKKDKEPSTADPNSRDNFPLSAPCHSPECKETLPLDNNHKSSPEKVSFFLPSEVSQDLLESPQGRVENKDDDPFTSPPEDPWHVAYAEFKSIRNRLLMLDKVETATKDLTRQIKTASSRIMATEASTTQNSTQIKELEQGLQNYGRIWKNNTSKASNIPKN